VGSGNPVDDVGRAVAVTQALGDRASVRVDVNQSWDESTAKRAIAGLEAGGIDVVEQPLAGWNIDAMRRLTERFSVTIMADEPVESPSDALVDRARVPAPHHRLISSRGHELRALISR
jgi:muconate cycloisomerase